MLEPGRSGEFDDASELRQQKAVIEALNYRLRERVANVAVEETDECTHDVFDIAESGNGR